MYIKKKDVVLLQSEKKKKVNFSGKKLKTSHIGRLSLGTGGALKRWKKKQKKNIIFSTHRIFATHHDYPKQVRKLYSIPNGSYTPITVILWKIEKQGDVNRNT